MAFAGSWYRGWRARRRATPAGSRRATRFRREGDAILLQNRMPYTPLVRFTDENASRAGGARTPGELSARLSREIVPGLALRAARRAIRESTR